jgi:hypothetical protein
MEIGMSDPKEIFQAKLDAMIEGFVEEAVPEVQDTVRRRLTERGPLNDWLCNRAYDAMRDHYADMADHYRDQMKDRGL